MTVETNRSVLNLPSVDSTNGEKKMEVGIIKSQGVGKILPSLLKAQKVIKHAEKDSTNTHYKNDYSTLASVLDSVKSPLNDNDIILLQGVEVVGGIEYLKTELVHTSGEYITGYTRLVVKADRDPQAYGSGITYSKRYGLMALLGISSADDDDDGNLASKTTDRKPKTQPTFTRKSTTDEGEF